MFQQNNQYFMSSSNV